MKLNQISWKVKNPLKIYIQKTKTDSEYLNELYEIYKIEPSGLINSKGVCYMNAVLQCLYCCASITKYFLTLDNSTQLGLVSKGYHDFAKGLFNGNKSAANSLRS